MGPNVSKDVTWWVALIAVLVSLASFIVVTFIVFTCPPSIPIGTATAYATLVGFPSVAIAFYQWSRRKEIKEEQ